VENEPHVRIIVVNWNGREFLAPVLRSIREQEYGNFAVSLVDNCSNDGSWEEARAEFPEFDAIRLDENIGFGAAVNIVFRQTGADYFALVNNDAVLEPSWLRAMVEAAEEDPRVGMVASTVSEEGAGGLESAGLALSGDGFAVLRAVDAGKSPLLGPTGAAALYSASMIEETGGFGDEFFLYYEDADLAMRARLLGWQCRHAREARAVHAHSASAGRNLRRKRRLLHRNRLLFISRCWPARLIAANLFWLLLGECGALGAMIIRGRFGDFFPAVADLSVALVRFPARRVTLSVKIAPDQVDRLLSDRLAGFLIFRRQQREAP